MKFIQGVSECAFQQFWKTEFDIISGDFEIEIPPCKKDAFFFYLNIFVVFIPDCVVADWSRTEAVFKMSRTDIAMFPYKDN